MKLPRVSRPKTKRKMSGLIYADTKCEPSYPGYVNFTREADGSVTLVVRSDPKTVNGSYVQVFEGQTAVIRLSAEEFDALARGISANGPGTA